MPKQPGFGRKGLAHKVISFVDSPLAIHGFDDEVGSDQVHLRPNHAAHTLHRLNSTLNAAVNGMDYVGRFPSNFLDADVSFQGHFYDQDLKMGYNGCNPSIQDLEQDYGNEDREAVLPTLNRKCQFRKRYGS